MPLLEDHTASFIVRIRATGSSASTSDPVTTIDRTALVFGRGDTIYVNRTRFPESIDDNDALVIRKFGTGTSLCRTDLITTFDRTSQFYSGNVYLAEFVPYKRIRR